MTTSRTHLTASLALGLMGLAALAGCAGPTAKAAPGTSSTAAPSPAAAATACDLVTEQDATTALGADPGAGTAVSASGASSCTFGHYPSIVTVNMLGPGGKADLAHIKSADTTGLLTDIPSLGDSAFGISKGTVASVWFSKGDTMVAIVVVKGSSGGPSLDQAKTVAATALSRF